MKATYDPKLPDVVDQSKPLEEQAAAVVTSLKECERIAHAGWLIGIPFFLLVCATRQILLAAAVAVVGLGWQMYVVHKVDMRRLWLRNRDLEHLEKGPPK